MTITKKPTNNVFQNIVRSVVREELAPFEEGLNRRFERFKEEIIDGVKSIVAQYRNDIATMKDEIMGELDTIRQEQIMHTGQHDRIDKRLDNLEALHPYGQHPA